MTLKPPWHSINLASVLWSLEADCGLVQGAAAWAGVPGSAFVVSGELTQKLAVSSVSERNSVV